MSNTKSHRQNGHLASQLASIKTLYTFAAQEETERRKSDIIASESVQIKAFGQEPFFQIALQSEDRVRGESLAVKPSLTASLMARTTSPARPIFVANL